ncbi:hypothetical protein BDR07DRAFT_1384201, partial [Suillus spraguei]
PAAITQANTTLYNIRPSSPPKTPAPQWSVRPQLAALQASCRLPLTSIYNACAQHQVVSVSQERFLHQPASHLIILAHHCPLQHLPKWSIHQRLVSSTHLRLQTRHSGIAPFNRLSTWILTCGSHHSDPPMPGVVYSPTPTDSTLGDRTIQPFVDLVHVNFQATWTFEDTTAIALAILSVRHFLKCADYQQCLEGPRLRARGPHNHIIGST